MMQLQHTSIRHVFTANSYVLSGILSAHG